MCRGIQQVAQQAFWDVLAEGLDQRPPQWERLLTLLEEARSMLLELIPENAEEGKQLRADVLDKLNMVRPQSLREIRMWFCSCKAQQRHGPGLACWNLTLSGTACLV